ncbi:putative Ran GDP binding protein [Trypanosoma conorhini]|uniref:Putative Ran GDP binding protein n=1 Tax=Trypanosoma conorhini TaxID=83891 RepID=A0A422Q289_9TRYP|nr:putative Ran GDP binding protein [Trypanosoma conorhini]RNF24078.1 putative Ran GDP binding protein [Trypanosoma conorhini]
MRRLVCGPVAFCMSVHSWSSLGCGAVELPIASRETQAMCEAASCTSRVSFATRSPLLLQSWAQRANRVWMCVKEECRHVNNPHTTECEACGAAKPSLKGWLCVECGTRNHKGVKKCHKCTAAAENSGEFWMCAACEQNNRIDDLDDNSRCGFCGYDMAPMTMTEAEALRIQQERSQRLREEQEQFDSISAKDADEQFGDETAGASALPKGLRQMPSAAASRTPLKVPEVTAFTPSPVATAHSRILKKPRRAVTTGIPPGPPGFDWMCRDPSCGTINAGDEESCSKCGKHITPAEWECCHCGAMNHLSRSRCFNCHIIIPVSWVCSGCKTSTSIYDRDCRQCGEPRPATEPKDPRDVQLPMHARGPAFAGGGRRQMSRARDWNCAECHGLNFASRTACYQCGAPRSAAEADSFDGASSASASPNVAVSHNNWFCRHCQASNFRTRTSCWQCGQASSESGATSWSDDDATPHFEKEGFQQESDESVAEGQVNVWGKKNDDWTCGKCFSKNFKNRQECHKCGAAKTVAVAPRRAFVRKPVKI